MINRAKMPRQMYGLGSLVKDRIRKLIPNELASVAVKAAPVVSVFNPGVGALMRGIGRFDQRGSISDAFKQGVGTFAFGKGVGMLGGAQSDPGFFGRQRFSMDRFSEGPIGRLFDKQQATDVGSKLSEQMSEVSIPTEKKGLISVTRDLARAAIKKLPDGVAAQLVAGGISAGASLLASYFQGEFEEQQPGETTEERLERRREYVGTQMRTYMDNYFANDPEYMKLDEAGKNALVARYNLNKGGRVNYSDGTKPSADEAVTQQMIDQKQMAMVEDMLKRGIDIDTIKTLTGASDEMIQDRINFIKYGGAKVPIKKADGGMPTGIMRINKAGVKERDYRDKGGFVPVGIKEKADDVPAMLSKNEFVFTADAVRGAGNGSIERGAQKMYDTMKRLEKRVV